MKKTNLRNCAVAIAVVVASVTGYVLLYGAGSTQNDSKWADPLQGRKQKAAWIQARRDNLRSGSREELASLRELQGKHSTPDWQKHNIRKIILQVVELPESVFGRIPRNDDARSRWLRDNWTKIDNWLEHNTEHLQFDEVSRVFRYSDNNKSNRVGSHS